MRSFLFTLLFMVPAVSMTGSQFIQQGKKLIGTGSTGIADQGQSVALSSDGNTAIVGGSFDSSGTGATWVFTRTGGIWAQVGSKLIGTGALDGASGARQGTSAAISADGNTAIVGGIGDNARAGAAWVFTRTGNVWTQQGSKLVGSGAVDGLTGARQGQSVSLSADGNTAIIGGPLDGGGTGAAWVFTRANGVWSQQGGKLFGSDPSGLALQGWSVSLSGDGNTAIIGGIYDDNDVGAAWVFTRSGGVWTQQGSKLSGLDATQGANQGWAVSLSADGNTAALGGISDNAGEGAVWVFTRTDGIWGGQGFKLVGSGAANGPGGANQGYSVSLSSDGNAVVVGGPNDSSGAGAVWVFTRTGGNWSQQGSKLSGMGAVEGDNGANQGQSVSISGDGSTAIVGASADDFDAGASWVFTSIKGLWVQQGKKLVGAGAVGNASQGQAVSLSSDGSTALVGGQTDSSGAGAAWVFVRNSDAWSQQGTKLIGRGALNGVTGAHQGSAVSLSSDGNTAIVGGSGDDSSSGAVWLFTRALGAWSQQGNKLFGSGAVGHASQGQSVALSGDGNTAIVGGANNGSGAGAVWVFTRTGGTWSQQGGKLVGSGASGPARQGQSVALSSDGNTVLIGGPSDNSGTGAAWVFSRSGGPWSQQGSKLTGSGAKGKANQGQSVSVSADGNTAIVGGPNDSSGTGAVWVFTRMAGNWSQQGRKLVGSGASGPANQGESVSLSGDGNTVVVGGSNDSSGVGAAWVFMRSGSSWSQQGSKIVGTGAVGNANEGQSVSLSADGNTAILGGVGDNSGSGAAWAFARTTLGVKEAGRTLPESFSLEQNYPNPFNPSTTIRFDLPSAASVSLDVFNILGEKVARLVEGTLAAGTHSTLFDASKLPSGIYLCRLHSGGYSATTKIVLLR